VPHVRPLQADVRGLIKMTFSVFVRIAPSSGNTARRKAAGPDPYSGNDHFSNPQSFNGYAYVGDNPLSMRESSGLMECQTVNATGRPIARIRRRRRLL
jgi:hypothetical protein